MSDPTAPRRTAPAGRHDRDLPPELRPAVAAWRAEPLDPPPLAGAVLAALREERPAPLRPLRSPRWRHAAAALGTALSLAVAGGLWRGGAPSAPPVPVADVPLAASPVAVAAATPEPEPPAPVSPAPRDRGATGRLPRTLVAIAPPLPDAGRWLSRDALVDAWAAVPASDPDRTWRDELADGVRPYRRGVDTALGLFARAVPPPPRSP